MNVINLSGQQNKALVRKSLRQVEEAISIAQSMVGSANVTINLKFTLSGISSSLDRLIIVAATVGEDVHSEALTVKKKLQDVMG